MESLSRLLLLLIAIGVASTANAAPAWYSGKVTRVWSYDATVFVVTLDSAELSDCAHGYAYVGMAGVLTTDFKVAYATALSAYLSGKTLGIVIDKAKNGPGGACYALSVDIRG